MNLLVSAPGPTKQQTHTFELRTPLAHLQNARQPGNLNSASERQVFGVFTGRRLCSARRTLANEADKLMRG